MTASRWFVLLALAAGAACSGGRSTPPSDRPNALPTTVSASLPTASAPSVLDTLLARLRPLVAARESLRIRLAPDSGTPRADSQFAVFRARYAATVQTVGSWMWDQAQLQTWITSDQSASDSVERLLDGMGFSLAWSEGSAFVDENTSILLELVAPMLTPAMREFLLLRHKEETEGFSDDAALRITWDQVGDRVASWEQFLETHPGFLLHDEIKGRYQLYLETYLTGMDNSRVFSLESDSLDPEVQRSYERFLKQHPDSHASRILHGYLELLAAHHYRPSDEATTYLRANGIRSMLGVQPPIR